MATRSTAAHLNLVCGMPLDPSKATAFSEHAGDPHQLCGRGCMAVSDKNPDGLLTSQRTNMLGADGPCGRQG